MSVIPSAARNLGGWGYGGVSLCLLTPGSPAPLGMTGKHS